MRDADLQPIGRAAPTALDGTEMVGNVRDSIAKWMTTSPSFSRAAVNRMWGHFLGRGFVDPVDAGGEKVVGSAFGVPDLLATCATLLGLDPHEEAMSPVGRPIAITDGGQAISAAIA